MTPPGFSFLEEAGRETVMEPVEEALRFLGFDAERACWDLLMGLRCASWFERYADLMRRAPRRRQQPARASAPVLRRRVRRVQDARGCGGRVGLDGGGAAHQPVCAGRPHHREARARARTRTRARAHAATSKGERPGLSGPRCRYVAYVDITAPLAEQSAAVASAVAGDAVLQMVPPGALTVLEEKFRATGGKVPDMDELQRVARDSGISVVTAYVWWEGRLSGRWATQPPPALPPPRAALGPER